MSTHEGVDRVAGSDGKSYPASYVANREAVRQAIADDPAATNTAIAKRVGCSRDVVIAVRKQVAAQATALVDSRYVAMCTAIAECHRVDEVKDLRDKALALEVYAKQAQNMDAERRAIEIRIRAEHRAGELLKAMPKASGGEYGGKPALDGSRAEPSKQSQRLADVGISKQQSHKWQQLASMPRDEFEATLADRSEPLSTNRLIASRAKPDPEVAEKMQRMNPQALKLWGQLRDFETAGFLKADMPGLLETMTDGMRADVLRLAPAIGEKLSSFGCAK